MGSVVSLSVHDGELATRLRPGIAPVAGIRIAIQDRPDDRLRLRA